MSCQKFTSGCMNDQNFNLKQILFIMHVVFTFTDNVTLNIDGVLYLR